jgi:hypothetical protein
MEECYSKRLIKLLRGCLGTNRLDSHIYGRQSEPRSDPYSATNSIPFHRPWARVGMACLAGFIARSRLR